MNWLLWLMAAAFLLLPLFVQAVPELHALKPPDDTSIWGTAWEVFRWVMGGMLALLIYIFQTARSAINDRIDNVERQIAAVKDDDMRNDEAIFGRLEERLDTIEAALDRRERDSNNVNTVQHEENRRRLDRIENKIDRALESVPTIIAAAQSDLYKRVNKLEAK